MRSPALLLIGAATVCGMIASIGLSQLLEAPAGKQARPVERVRIYVAQRDIAPGQSFSEANLRLETWDADSVPPGVVVRFEETLGKVSRERIKAGEPLQAGWLALVSRPAALAPNDHSTVAVVPPAAPDASAALPAAAAAASPHVSHGDATPAPSQPVEPTQAEALKSDVAAQPSTQPTPPPATPPTTTPPTETPPTTGPATTSPEDAALQAVVEQAKPRPASQAAQSPTPGTPTEVREAKSDGVADRDPQFAATEAPRVSATPRNPKAVGSISDAGWVMTIRREGGVKSLRYRVTSEVNREATNGGHSPTPARQPAEEPLDDRAARKTGDSKKS